MNLHAKRLFPLLGALALGFMALGNHAFAANSVWSATTTGTTWSVAGDWSSGGIPNANTVEFAATATSGTLYNDISSLTISGIQFDAAAPAYTINGNGLTLTGNITNNSTALQTINTAITTTGVRTVTMTAGGGNVLLGGNIGGSGGGITLAGAGTLTLSGSNSYTSNTTTASGTILVDANNNAFGTGTLNLSGGTGVFEGDGNPRTISNAVDMNNSGFTIAGSSSLNFSGLFTYAVSGASPLMINNSALTTFSGGWMMSNSTGGRTDFPEGSGNILINSLIQPSSTDTANAQGITYSGSGTLTLSAGNGSGGVSGVGGGTGSSALIQVASGGAFGTGVGNSTLKISGSYTIGTAGVASLVVEGGNGTTTTQGTLTMVDGSINTLYINSTAAAGSTALTIGAGGATNLDMEVGSGASDTITLGSGLKASVGAGGVVSLNLTSLGGVNLGAATENLTLITAPGGGFTAGSANNVSVASSTGNFGGYQTAVFTNTITTALILTLGGAAATPATAYWTGDQNSIWNTYANGLASNTNWTSDPAGAADTHQVPGSTTNVYFIASSGSASSGNNLSTTLGANTSINSLTFTANTSNLITIGGTNSLTINASGTNGITVVAGAGPETIGSSVPVSLGASQTWAVNNSPSNPLTVNGNISGGSDSLIKSGTGSLVLGGTNTFTGGLTINDGIVQLTNASALNSSTPNSVTFGNSTTARLQIDGNSVSIGGLSTNATPGSVIVENASSTATPATLTVASSNNSTFAGVLQDGIGGGSLSLVKSGTGSLTLGGADSYSGSTSVNNGTLIVNNSLSASSSVTVQAAADNTSAILGGTGTITNLVTISGTSGAGRVNLITAGTVGTSGTLTLAGGLSFGTGAIGYFDNGDYLNVTGGALTVANGVILQVTYGLAPGVYPLIGYVGSNPTLSNFQLEALNGSAVSTNYSLVENSDVLDLDVANATTAIPSLTLTSPVGGTRLMKSTTITIGGQVGNTGTVTLNGTLADNGGSLTATGFSPSIAVVSASSSQSYTASVNTGTTLGANTINVIVTDTNASPTTATATVSVSVVDNRVVSASAVSFGPVHIGATASGSTTLASAGADNSYTRVTVADAAADSNGISVTGGNTATVFNGSASDTRTVSGVLNTLGAVNGPITLVTTGEGLTGESPINVPVSYSAQVFSGKAQWNSTVGGTWSANASWADTQAGDLGGQGAPGLAGSVVSAGDSATFGDVAGESGTTTVTLDSASPTLASITFSGTGTSYVIAPGNASNSITLQGTATPISVTGTHTISAVLTGGGLAMTGSGALILAGANTYTGATSDANGILELATTNNVLPVGTNLTLGSGNASAELLLGGTSARSQTLASLATAGTGAANSVVAGPSGTSTLTINNTAADTYTGTLGGSGANQNSVALVKTGAGTLILTGNNTYTGGTTLTTGILNLGSAGALGTTGAITFNGGTLQFSGSNNSDYSSRFAGIGNNAYTLDTNGVNVTLASPLLTDGGAAQGLVKNGLGSLTIAAGNTYTGSTIVNAGTLITPNMSTNTVVLQNSGVWEPTLTGSTLYTPTIGQTGAGALNSWAGGGFAANGGALSVLVNSGSSLNWGSGSFQAPGTNPMEFGALTANNLVNFENSFDFGGATGNLSANFNRVIDVEGAAPTFNNSSPFGISGNAALLSGVITANVPLSGTGGSLPIVGDIGNDGFVKTGNGTLILSNANTYSGPTIISDGTIVAGTNALALTGTAGTPGAFGDGHTTVNATNGSTVAGTLSVTLGDGNINAGDGTAANNASPTVLIGGPFTVSVPITVANIATTGTYGIGGSTDNPSTFSGLITTAQNLSVYQVANTGANALNLSGTITTTVGVNTVKTVTFANVGNVDVNGSIVNAAGGGNGSLNVTQAGPGVTTINSSLTYTGTTTVNGGELLVAGGLSGTTVVNVGPAGQLAVNGSVNLGAPISVSGILSGIETTASEALGNVTVQNGGTLAPGTPNTISNLYANNITLMGGGKYTLKLNNDGSAGASAAGTDWDQLYFVGLNLSNASLTSVNPFVLNLQTLDLSGNDNPLASFNPSVSHTWNSILNFTGITGSFSASDFAVNTTNFLSPTDGGTFSVVLDTANVGYDTLDLEFTPAPIPEPGAWAMMFGGFGMLLGIQRYRRRL